MRQLLEDNYVRSVAVIGTRGYPSYYGGFETAVRKIAPFLAELGWGVTVYGRPGSTKTDDPEIDARVKTPVTWGIESKSLSTLTFGFTAVVHSLFNKPDVALVMNVANGFWLPLLKARGIRTVVNVDGIEWDREKWSKTAKAVFRLGARMTARYADEIVVDSKEIGRRWKKQFGVDGTYIAYGADAPPRLPLENGLADKQYVLMVARLVPENTINEFLDAAEELAATRPVVIVGSSGYGGEIEERVRAVCAALPNITWLGHVADDQRLLALWQHAGVYFHGHSVGGTNPALVQAMACEVPIVARDTIYNREVLGAHAVFVQPDRESIVAGITRVMNHPEDAGDRARHAQHDALVRFSWATICSAYRDTLLAQTIVNHPEIKSTD